MRYSLLLVAFLFVNSAQAQLSNDECLACHDTVDAAKFTSSVHGPLECTNCHADITAVPHEPAAKPVDCATCHTESVAAWDNSLHARAVKTGVAKGAKCADCHGSPHAILAASNPNSPAHHSKIPQTCAVCHAQKFVMEKAGLSAQSAMSYQQSVHGRAIAAGNNKAAVCTDCHEHHAVLPANDPQSGIFKFNVGRTCGQCHNKVAAQYGISVHGKALARGNWASPVCTDCHGIHTISKTSDVSRGPRGSCANCHEGVRLTREFAVSANKVASYEKSYHGLAKKLGSDVAADCASCHGAHDVLPASDRRSMIHPANLTNTCGKCHEGAQANFTRGKIHLDDGEVTDTPTRAVVWIRWIYIVLIIATIGGMMLHNIIVWWSKAQRARKASRRTVVRMNLNQRVQHILLVTSFTVLVISGFALAYPESFFATMMGANEAFRRIVHRIAAVVMILLGIYHLAYMSFTREGRKGLRDFWFRFRDLKDAIGVITYYLGLSPKRPEFGRFSYAEKAEYWAGLWGTIVMSITGLMIWYSVEVATWIPRWWIDIATTIHLYEAILATLAIVVWHFYHVIFDPDIYPMNWAWYDGKMTEEQYKHEHGLDVPEKLEEA